jgi:hypothetical protein
MTKNPKRDRNSPSIKNSNKFIPKKTSALESFNNSTPQNQSIEK